MEEKIEIKGKETIVCRIDNSEMVQCDVYKGGELTKTYMLPKDKIKDIIRD